MAGLSPSYAGHQVGEYRRSCTKDIPSATAAGPSGVYSKMVDPYAPKIADPYAPKIADPYGQWLRVFLLKQLVRLFFRV